MAPVGTGPKYWNDGILMPVYLPPRPGVFYCPSSSYRSSTPEWDKWGIGINWVALNRPKKISRFRSPSKTYAFADADHPPTPPTVVGGKAAPWGGVPSFRHTGCCNVLFLDGHVKAVPEINYPADDGDPRISGNY